MAIPSLELSNTQKNALRATNSPECRDLAESTIVPYSAIVSALESIQDQTARDICAKAFDAQETAVTLISKLKSEIGTTSTTHQTEKDRLAKAKTEAAAAVARWNTTNQAVSADDEFIENGDQDARTLAEDVKRNMKLMIVKTKWQGFDDLDTYRHIDDNLLGSWAMTENYEHVWRFFTNIGAKIGIPLITVRSRDSAFNIVNYSHEAATELINGIVSQYGNGSPLLKIGKLDPIDFKDPAVKDAEIRKILERMNNSIISEESSWLWLGTLGGLYVAFEALSHLSKIPLVWWTAPVQWISHTANEMKERMAGIAKWSPAKTKGFIQSVRDKRAAQKLGEQPEVGLTEDQKKMQNTQMKEVKDGLKDALWDKYQNKYRWMTRDNFRSALDLPGWGGVAEAKLEYNEIVKKADKFLPIDLGTLDPSEVDTHIREIAKLFPMGAWNRVKNTVFRAIFESTTVMDVALQNRWVRFSARTSSGSYAPALQMQSETLGLALDTAKLNVGGTEVEVPRARLSTYQAILDHFNRIEVVDAIGAEARNLQNQSRASQRLARPEVADLKWKSLDDVKKEYADIQKALRSRAQFITATQDLKAAEASLKWAQDALTRMEQAEKALETRESAKNNLDEQKSKYIEKQYSTIERSIIEAKQRFETNTSNAWRSDAIRTGIVQKIGANLASGVENLKSAELTALMSSIEQAVTEFNNENTSNRKSQITGVDDLVRNGRNAIKNIKDVDKATDLKTVRDAYVDADKKWKSYKVAQKTDFFTEKHRLQWLLDAAQEAHNTRKLSYDRRYPIEARDQFKIPEAELRTEAIRLKHYIRMSEIQKEAESKKPELRTSVEQAAGRVWVSALELKPDATGKLSSWATSILDGLRAQTLASQVTVTDFVNRITTRYPGSVLHPSNRLEVHDGTVPKMYDLNKAEDQAKLFREYGKKI